MKKNEIIFWSIKLPLDFLTVFISFFIARELRLITDLILSINLPIQTIDSKSLFIYAIIWSFLITFLFSIHSLYFIKITYSKIKEFLEIVRYSFYSFIFFSVIVFLWIWFIFEIEIPRLIILFTFIISTILIILQRIILNNIQYFLLKKWIITKKKVILINNKNEEKIKAILKDLKDSKIYEVIGYINTIHNKFEKKSWKNIFWDIKYLWSIDKAKILFEEKKMWWNTLYR